MAGTPTILHPGVSGLPLSGSDYNDNFFLIEQSFLGVGPVIVSGLVPSIGSGLAVNISPGVAIIGAQITATAFTIAPLPANQAIVYLYLQQNGQGTSNTTGIPPAASVLLGTAVTGPATVTSVTPALPKGQAMIQSGTVAARPTAGNAGAEYLPNDGIYVYRDNGSIWQPWGPLWPLTEPVSGSFAWINQGAATIDATRGGAFLFAPANASTNMRIREITAPATPYTITMAMLPSWAPDPGTFPLMGLCFRESGTGKLVTWAYNLATTPRVTPQKWTSPTVFSVAYTPLWDAIGNMRTGPLVWMRVVDDGVNLGFWASNDGRQWFQSYSVSRTDFLAGGPNRVGFFVNSNQGTYDTAMWVTHWLQS